MICPLYDNLTHTLNTLQCLFSPTPLAPPIIVHAPQLVSYFVCHNVFLPNSHGTHLHNHHPRPASIHSPQQPQPTPANPQLPCYQRHPPSQPPQYTFNSHLKYRYVYYYAGYMGGGDSEFIHASKVSSTSRLLVEGCWYTCTSHPVVSPCKKFLCTIQLKMMLLLYLYLLHTCICMYNPVMENL